MHPRRARSLHLVGLTNLLAALLLFVGACASSNGVAGQDDDGGSGSIDGGVDSPSGADFWEACTLNGECESGWCYVPVPNEPGHCTDECNGSCPDGYECRVVRVNGITDVRLCVLAEETMCDVCEVSSDCGDSRDLCMQMTAGKFCVIDCRQDPTVCPAGFTCQTVLGDDDVQVKQCMPLNGVCCVDGDDDRRGAGAGCITTDCNDADPDIYDDALEVCDGKDNDCRGGVDNDPFDCGGPMCELGQGGYFSRGGDVCDGESCVDQAAVLCGLYTCAGGGEEGDTCATACDAEDDHLCVAAAHCDASTCFADLDDGLQCNEDTDCESAHCQNGFCCAFGDCCQEASDCPSFGTFDPVCENPTTCQGTRGEAVCNTNSVCGTTGMVQDDSACADDMISDECGWFRPVTCSGAVGQSDPACPTHCTSHGDCDDGAWCDPVSDVCVEDLPDGATCGDDDDRCRTDHCENGFCCGSGDCCFTATDCPDQYRTAPVCTSPTACDGEADIATCLASTCGTAADVDNDSACGATTTASTCGSYVSIYCNGSSTQTAPEWVDERPTAQACDSTAYCSTTGQCLPDEPDGGTCQDDGECQAGHCQNGFCCASGDCCADADDCNAYDRAPVCGSAATCQGSRGEGVCSPTFQCGETATVADDSGCAGLEANDCGPFPAQQCTASPDQSPPTCTTSCTGDGDCDFSAHCDGDTCAPDTGPGGYCDEPSDCGSGLNCVDDVCCNTACTGGCEACDLPGSVGACTKVAGGQDPDNECGAVGCTGFFHGFNGDSCLRKADVPANIAACNGAGACRTAAQECGAQGSAGPVVSTCHGDCQNPTTNTCTGTVPGACTNVNPGTQSCGTGDCARTAPICQNGAPATCNPGAPATEVCDDRDNNCDGTIDNGAFSDIYETHSNCDTATQLGTVQSDQSNAYNNMTIYGSGDYDYYKITMEENDNSCGCGFPWLDEDYQAKVWLTVPPGAGSYEICMTNNDCGFPAGNCFEVLAGDSLEIQMWLDGGCPGNDSYNIKLRIRGDNAPGFECRGYDLSYNFDAGHCR